MILQKRIFIPLFLFLLILPAGLRAASGIDYSSWDAFLQKYVNKNGDVDYQSIKKDPKALDDFLANLAAAEPGVKGGPREETLAFWLNAYHAVLIKQVVQNYPVVSVERIPSFWDITLFHVGRKDAGEERFSLNDIRDKNLIKVYRDEKIHLALSVAAKSGPKLMREAFTGPKVEGQLFVLTRKFVTDPFYVDITPGKKKIRISKIFKWYGEDFKLDFGTSESRGKFSDSDNAVLSFLAYYLEDEEKGAFLQEGHYKIEYPAFDWALNDWKKGAS